METASVHQEQARDEVREHLSRMWDGVAPGWGEHAAFVDARAAAMTEAMLGLARIEPGARVLELAGGAGGAGLAAAARVGTGGEVVISDVSPRMTAIAQARADELGLRNVRTRALDLEEIDEPDASYDAVICREALMLVPDPARAVAEIARVLRPGGRVALSVWGPRAENPWLGVVFDAVGAQIGIPMPPPGLPGPFSLDDRDRLAHVLDVPGLTAVEIRHVATPYLAGSAEEWWARTAALAGPLAQRLASLPEPAARAVFARAREGVRPYENAAELSIPGLALVAGAQRR
jgi:ubiquinone/menaquinone biosynthesis C-methylase UbiE